MDKDHRSARAKSLINDEMFDRAFKETKESVTNHLLHAKTPEEREQRFQEYQGLVRAERLLRKWAVEAE